MKIVKGKLGSTSTFTFPMTDQTVRVIMRDGEPWFVANDIAALLGYARPKDAVAAHCKRPKILKGGDSEFLTLSPRGIHIISEPDVYRLIMHSNLPTANKFQDWVVEIVLPTIRKDGVYIIGEEKVHTGEISEDELLAQALAMATQKLERLSKERSMNESNNTTITYNDNVTTHNILRNT